MGAECCCRLIAAVGNSGWPGKKIGCGMPLVACWCCCWGIPVSQEHGCRMLLPIGSCWGQILFNQKKIRLRNAACGSLVLQLGNPGWPGKKPGRRMPLVVGCCCSESWLARKMGAERCCWLVVADGESWLARKKTRLGNATCRWLLLLGILVSQEIGCKTLLLVGSCWLRMLVG